MQKACYTCSHPISEETVAPNLCKSSYQRSNTLGLINICSSIDILCELPHFVFAAVTSTLVSVSFILFFLLSLIFSALRTAIQAFRREEDLLMYRASKRRRERFEQVSCVSYQWQNYNHTMLSIFYKDIHLSLCMFCSPPSV